MAETIKIVFKVDGKEITATEKDLKDLQKATKKLQGEAKKSRVSMKGLGGALAAVGTAALAAAAGVIAFGAETLKAARELDNLAKRAGIGVEEFQRMAFAAKSVGIEQDKLSDIFLDTNDKLGDFINTGAGPLADFFDTIGKKVGIQIEDFKGLSGPQALGLYVDSLDKANVSQSEMTFFMEAIASDATALAPLLVNNAAGFKELGLQAGKVLSQEQIDNAQELNKAFDSMASTIGNELKAAFINAATEAADFFNLLEGSLARNKLDELREQAAEMGASLNELLDEGTMDERAQGIAKSFGIAYEEIGPWWNKKFVPATDDAMRELRRQMAKTMNFGIQEANAFKETIVDASEAAAEALVVGDPTGEGSGTTSLEEEKDAKSELLSECQKLALAEQKAADAEILRFEKVKEEMGLVHDFALVHLQDLKDLQALLATGEISAARYAEEIRKLAEGDEEEDGGPFAGLIEELNSIESIMAETVKGGINDMSDALTDMVVSGKADFAGLAKSILSDIARMIVKMLILRAISSFLPGSADKGGAVLASVPSADHGGTVGKVGDPVLIGTGAQPELFVPTTAGTFFPKQQLGGSGGGTSNVFNITSNVTVEGGGAGDAEDAEKISRTVQREIRTMVQQVLINEQRSGNILNPANVHDFR